MWLLVLVLLILYFAFVKTAAAVLEKMAQIRTEQRKVVIVIATTTVIRVAVWLG